MLDVRLSRAAKIDFESIAVYTIGEFGLAVARNYRDSLLQALDSLTTHPLLGSDQSQIRTGLRRLVHQRHSILYRVRRNDIFVVRILGPGQNPKTEFKKQ